MKKSSDLNMEQLFDQLANIKKVEPRVDLYKQILAKQKAQNTIPMFWVRAAACLLILFFATEFYIVSNTNSTEKQDITIVIPKTNNTLYNE